MIKEGETKLEKLNESIDNAEKLIKKREKELLKFAKSPSRKESIYDYEIRLKMAKDDKDKLEVERKLNSVFCQFFNLYNILFITISRLRIS